MGQKMLHGMKPQLAEAMCSDVWQPLLNQGLLDLMVDSFDIEEPSDVEMLMGCLSMIVGGTAWENTFRHAFSWENIPPRILAQSVLPDADFFFSFGAEVKYLGTLLAPQVGRTPAELVRAWDQDGVSLTHTCFVLSAGFIAHDEFVPYDGCNAAGWDETMMHAGLWHRHIRELMDASDDIHRKMPVFGHLGINDALSPFCAWLFRYANDPDPSISNFRKGIRTLTTILRDCNVDLRAYGEAEAAIISGVGEARRLRDESPLFLIPPGRNKLARKLEGTTQRLHLRELHYGPCPEDWRLEWEFVFDNEELCGDFWNMIERPPLNIRPPPLLVPGAWPEEWD